MTQSNYDVFVSYRRGEGTLSARAVVDELKSRGVRVFFDAKELKSGRFDDAILQAIDSSKDFVLVLAPGALDRCVKGPEEDWVAKEICYAMSKGKNIIPFLLKGFQFPNPMPECLKGLELFNGPSGVDPADAKVFELHVRNLTEDFLSKTEAGPVDVRVSTGPMSQSVNITVQKKNGIYPFVIAALLLLIATAGAGGFWYFNNKPDNKPSEKQFDKPAENLTAAPVTAKSDSAEKQPEKPKKPVDDLKIVPVPEQTHYSEFSPAITQFAKDFMPADYKRLIDFDKKAEEIRKNMIEIRSNLDASVETKGMWSGNADYEKNAEAFTVLKNDAETFRKKITEAYAKHVGARTGTPLPPPPKGVSKDRAKYTTSRGDTTGAIAKKLGCTVSELKKANPDFDFINARIGSVINIPKSATVRKITFVESEDVPAKARDIESLSIPGAQTL